MRCPQIQKLLNEYLEGSLERASREVVQAHLQQCAACRRELALLNILYRELPRLPEPKLPPQLGAQIQARLQVERWASRQGIPLWKSGWVWATAVPLFILAFSLGAFSARPDGILNALMPSLFSPKPVPSPPPTPPRMEKSLQIEWRNVKGQRVPVLIASEIKPTVVSLSWSTETREENASPQVLWQGVLNPEQKLVLPLVGLKKDPLSHSDGVILWWQAGKEKRTLFLPTHSAPIQRATLHLRGSLKKALWAVAAQYRVVIEWQPIAPDDNPMVVLAVEEVGVEKALEALLEGTPYRSLQKAPGHWLVYPE